MCTKAERAGADSQVGGKFSLLHSFEELRIEEQISSRLSLCYDEHLLELHPSFATFLSPFVSLRSLSLRFCGVTSRAMFDLASIISEFVHMRFLTCL